MKLETQSIRETAAARKRKPGARELRVFVFLHRIPHKAIARVFGCSRPYITLLLNGRPTTERTLERLRRAVAEANAARRRQAGAPAALPQPAGGGET
jgi:hypothetical protein